MARLERTIDRRVHHVPFLKRASWGAIFGGAFTTMAVMAMLGALGVAIGAATIDPAEPSGSPSARALAIGAAIWWIASGIISLFVGGFVTGRLSGLRRRFEGTLHGIVTWALVSVVAVFFATSMLGTLVSGAFRVVGATTGAVASGAVSAVQGAAGAAAGADAPDVEWNKVWNEAQQVLRQTESPELQKQVDAAQREIMRDLRRADVEAALSTLYRRSRRAVSAVDKQAAVNVLVARTNMQRQEAEQLVDRWSSSLQNAWQQTSQQLSSATTAVQRAGTQAGQATAEAVSSAAAWSFFYLLLTGIAAALGGMLGAPRTDAPVRPVTEEEEVYARAP